MRLEWIGALVVLLALALVVAPPAPMVRAGLEIFDAMHRWVPAGAASGDVWIVEIDELSLQSEGRWPWPRARLAALIDSILAAGAATVALDIMFPETDSGQPAPGAPSNDALLARSLSSGKVLLGYYFEFEAQRGGGTGSQLHPLPVAFVDTRASAVLDLFAAGGTIHSIPELAAAAAGSGFLNAGLDRDGKLRRVPLLMRYVDRIYPSLPLAAVLRRQGISTVALETAWHGGRAVRWSDRRIATSRDATAIPARTLRSGQVPRISAATVLRGGPAVNVLRNRLVIVGGSALGLQDAVTTPADPRMPGVEVQAVTAENLLHGSFLERPPMAQAIEALATLVAGAIAVAVCISLPPGAALALIAVLLGACSAGAIGLLISAQWLVLPLGPVLAVAAATAVLVPLRLRRRERHAAQTAEQQQSAKEFALMAVAEVLDLRDPVPGCNPGTFPLLVRLLCEAAARHPRFAAELAPETIDRIVELAPLRDIGKAGVPDSVLQKRSPLTPKEAELLRLHVEQGRQVLDRARRRSGFRDQEVLRLATAIVYSHHERWDGTGYPKGLRAGAIPLAGRVLAIADAYQTLTSRKLPQDTMPHDIAVRILAAGRGTHFDPDLIDIFLENHQFWREAIAGEDAARRKGAASS